MANVTKTVSSKIVSSAKVQQGPVHVRVQSGSPGYQFIQYDQDVPLDTPTTMPDYVATVLTNSGKNLS